MKNIQDNRPNTNAIKETPGDDSRNVLTRHLSSFLDNNMEALMCDYTKESVLITREATYSGIEEIESFFAGLMTHFPKQKSSFELDKMVTNGELAYIIWHAKTPSVHVPLGSDTFIIKDNKIYQQTFVGQLDFVN